MVIGVRDGRVRGGSIAAVHEIAAFLGRFPPFDTLDQATLDAAAAATRIEFHAAGSVIRPQGAGASTAVGVVRRGTVELRSGGRVIDLLAAGEMFGHPSLLAGEPAELSVVAHEDTLVYAIAAAAIVPVLARPAGLRYVARSLGERVELRTAGASLAAGDAAEPTAGTLIRRAPLRCPPQTTVQEAARLMTEAHSSSILIDLPRGLGIVTNRDLRTRVVAAGLSPTTPVSAVMTAPAVTATADRSRSQLLVEMLERDVHHLPVIDPGGRLLGVVAAPDLLARDSRAPFHLRSAISSAADLTALRSATARLPEMVIALAAGRTDPQVTGRMIAAVHDALTARLIDLAERELGPPPAAYAWLTLGSVARREAAPSSDHDSALVYARDDPGVAAWMQRLATMVVEGLERCGIPRCANGAEASRPLMRRSVAGWRAAVSAWLEHPDAGLALILAPVVIDGRRLYGSEQLAGEVAGTLAGARDHAELMHRMGVFALAHRPPTGFFGNLVLTHDGDRRPRLDIKRGGLLPVVDLARWAAMSTGLTGASTIQRIEAAEAAGALGQTDAATLRDAFALFTELRMNHQVAQLEAGDPADDRLDPGALSPLARANLRQAFREIARVQRGIGYTGLPAR